MYETVLKEKSLRFAVGTHQLYLHPPFLAARKNNNLLKVGSEVNIFYKTHSGVEKHVTQGIVLLMLVKNKQRSKLYSLPQSRIRKSRSENQECRRDASKRKTKLQVVSRRAL